jgi:hypothetical protein
VPPSARTSTSFGARSESASASSFPRGRAAQPRRRADERVAHGFVALGPQALGEGGSVGLSAELAEGPRCGAPDPRRVIREAGGDGVRTFVGAQQDEPLERASSLLGIGVVEVLRGPCGGARGLAGERARPAMHGPRVDAPSCGVSR